MGTPRRLALILLALASTTLATLSVSAAFRDTTAPRLYYEAPLRLPEGDSAEVFVSADEPVTYVVTYGETRVEEVAQDHTFVLTIVAGDEPVIIEATDAAGNVTEVSSVINGVALVELELVLPPRIRSGDPLGTTLKVSEGGAAVVATDLSLDGESGRTLATEDGTYAVFATPFTVDPDQVSVVATVTDEFGRSVEVSRQVEVEPLSVRVEQLALSPQTLAVITPEGAELERATLSGAVALGAGEPLWSEPFLMPIEGRESSGFADARRYVEGGRVSYHNGLDLAAPLGTPVAATNDGRVMVAGPYPIKGGWILIDHGFGLSSLYFHLSRIDVEVGDHVKKGDIIGLVGSTGLSTGPHLHWEMRLGERPTNPLAWADRSWP